MDQPNYHKRLHLQNFTVFKDAGFDFVPGINAFVGENGTGKTHVLKALYAYQFTRSREGRAIDETLEELFQTKNLSDVVRSEAGAKVSASVRGLYGDHSWTYRIQRGGAAALTDDRSTPRIARPVFLPALDMMGHTRGFAQAYADVRLDFDLTCSDIVNLLALEKKDEPKETLFNETLAKLLGGEIERDESGRFYLATPLGRQPMPMVAEGLRKIAALVQLHRNGWLSPGATLFWDEPEVNLNPVLMDEVVGALLALARGGVQVFLATHSYVILREIEVQAEKSDKIRFFAFSRAENAVTVHPANSYLDIAPNPIERQYAELYDRGIEKRIKALEAS